MKSNKWRAAALEMNGQETWYVVDDEDTPHPVAIVPRGEAVARQIAGMQAQVARLREALRPLASVADTFDGMRGNKEDTYLWAKTDGVSISVADAERASAAMAASDD